jgi:hypothetical protein
VKHVLYCTALMVGAFTIGSAQAAPVIPPYAPQVIGSNASGATVSVGVLSVVQLGVDLGKTSGTHGTFDSGVQKLLGANAASTTSVSGRKPIVNTLVSADVKIAADAITSHSYASPLKAFNGVPQSVVGTVELVNAGLTLDAKAAGFSLASIGLSTGDIISTSTVSFGKPGPGQKSVYSATGSSTITGLSLDTSLLGLLGISVTVPVDPTPNFNLVNIPLLGIQIILNEQKSTVSNNANGIGNGATMETNAIHVILNNFLLGGALVNADVILGHSFASVPEPESWAMMILGFGLIGQVLRRKGAMQVQLRRRQLA